MGLEQAVEFATNTAEYAAEIGPTMAALTIIALIQYNEYAKRAKPDTIYEQEIYKSLSRARLGEAKNIMQEAYSILKYEFTQMPTFAAIYRHAIGQGEGKSLFWERKKK